MIRVLPAFVIHRHFLLKKMRYLSMTNWNHLVDDHTTFSLLWPAIGKGSVPRFFYLIDEYPNRTSTTQMQSYNNFLKVG